MTRAGLCLLCDAHHVAHHAGTLVLPRAPRHRPRPHRPRPAPTAPTASAAGRFGATVLRVEARSALVRMGWAPAIAGPAVDQAIAHVGVGAELVDVIRAALLVGDRPARPGPTHVGRGRGGFSSPRRRPSGPARSTRWSSTVSRRERQARAAVAPLAQLHLRARRRFACGWIITCVKLLRRPGRVRGAATSPSSRRGPPPSSACSRGSCVWPKHHHGARPPGARQATRHRAHRELRRHEVRAEPAMHARPRRPLRPRAPRERPTRAAAVIASRHEREQHAEARSRTCRASPCARGRRQLTVSGVRAKPIDRRRRLERQPAVRRDLREPRARCWRRRRYRAACASGAGVARLDHRADEPRVPEPQPPERARRAPAASRSGGKPHSVQSSTACGSTSGSTVPQVAHRRVVRVQDQPPVRRIARREVELERAALVVDMPVLDPRDARHVHEPRHHAQPRERPRIRARRAKLRRGARPRPRARGARRRGCPPTMSTWWPAAAKAHEIREHRAMRLRDHPHAHHTLAPRPRPRPESPLVRRARRQLGASPARPPT